MRRTILVFMVFFITSIHLTLVEGDRHVSGDDLIETIFYGTITDKVTGNPIDEVMIFAYDSEFNFYQSDVTGTDGEYYLEFDIGGDFYIYAQETDYQTYETNISVKTNDKTELDIILVPVDYEFCIYGVVTDSDTGNPLEYVCVELYQIDNGHSYINRYFTETDGKYYFGVYQGTYSVMFDRGGYDPLTEEPVSINGQDVELNVELEPWDQGVYGMVIDENGDPLEGIAVSLANDNNYLYNITDDDGAYRIMAPDPGEYEISAYQDGYRPYKQTIEIEDGDMIEIEIQLQKTFLPDPIVRLILNILSWLSLLT